MPDLYGKLGDLLNEVLESGKIPEEKINSEAQKEDRKAAEATETTESVTGSYGPFSFSQKNNNSKTSNSQNSEKTNTKTENIRENKKKQEEKPVHNYNFKDINGKKINNNSEQSNFSQGEVIKMYKYTEFMHFPADIQNAITTLDIAYPFTNKELRLKYHKLVKTLHPDKNTIQTSQSVLKTRQVTIEELSFCYNLLKKYFFGE